MFQKESKYKQDVKPRRSKTIETKEYRKARRPVVFSSDDVAQMARERSRAKLIRQLTSEPAKTPDGEFSSYFHGPNQQIDPVYSVTSHTTKERRQTYRNVLPTYPSLVQSLRWHPEVESSSIHNFQTNRESETATCRCRECVSKNCRGKSMASEHKRYTFKDNITRFADSSSMTLKQNDASCGSSTPVISSKTSDASVSVDTGPYNCTATVSQACLSYDPVSILKKNTKYEPVRDCDQTDYDYYGTQTEKKCRIADDFQEAVKDTEEDDFPEPNISRPIRTFPKITRRKLNTSLCEESEPRINIYNEGISDLLINNLPYRPPSYTEQIEMPDVKYKIPRSSGIVNKKTFKREEIPFTHSKESRYHYDCKKPEIKPYYVMSDSIERLATSTKSYKKTFPSQPLPFNNIHAIRYPRRVLSSEQDIESYFGSRL